MRVTLIAMGALLAATAAGVGTSEAQSKGPKPWCIAGGAFGQGSLDCTYWTYKQCYDSARGAGGSCVENPEILWARRGYPTRQSQGRYDR